MNVANIVSLARAQTGGVTTTQISDAQMLIYLNVVYQELLSEVAEKTDKKLTWQEWKADTVAGQSEYILPKLDTGTNFPGLKKMVNIYVKYKSTDTYYTRVRVLEYEVFGASSDYLAEYQDYKAEESGVGENPYPYPFVVRADERSIFLNPVSNESVTDGLKIQGLYTPLDLTLLSDEDDIALQREFHDLLSLGLEKYIRGDRQVDSKRNIAINRYTVLKQNVLSQMNNVAENARLDQQPFRELNFYE